MLLLVRDIVAQFFSMRKEVRVVRYARTKSTLAAGNS